MAKGVAEGKKNVSALIRELYNELGMETAGKIIVSEMKKRHGLDIQLSYAYNTRKAMLGPKIDTTINKDQAENTLIALNDMIKVTDGDLNKTLGVIQYINKDTPKLFEQEKGRLLQMKELYSLFKRFDNILSQEIC